MNNIKHLCGEILEYDFESGMYFCKKCCEFYPVNMFDNSECSIQRENDKRVLYIEDQKVIYDCGEAFEYMEADVYSCNQCSGSFIYYGELEENMCPYCGQLSLNRKESEKCVRPNYFVPFWLDKEKAIEIYERKFKNNYSVPREFRKVRESEIKKVFVPYYSYDISYREKNVQVISEVRGVVRNVFDAELRMKNKAIEAGDSIEKLNSRGGIRMREIIGTLNRRDKEIFSEGNMNECYIQCGFNEDDIETIRQDVEDRAKREFGNRRYKELNVVTSAAKPQPVISNVIEYNKVTHNLLPVWVITKRYLGKKYTVIVDGVEGNLLGAVPNTGVKCIWKSLIVTALVTLFNKFIITIDTDSSLLLGAMIFEITTIAIIYAFCFTNPIDK